MVILVSRSQYLAKTGFLNKSSKQLKFLMGHNKGHVPKLEMTLLQGFGKYVRPKFPFFARFDLYLRWEIS